MNKKQQATLNAVLEKSQPEPISSACELSGAFRESVDTYLEYRAEKGPAPERPFSGKILLRTRPALHRKAALRAAAEGISLSQWISRQIESAS